MRRLRKQMSYANVMSSIAVFVVLGGGAYAAATLPTNSVGSKQIKANAVTSSKVKNGSLLSSDFKPGQLVAGVRGSAGPAGAAGATGAAGAAGPKGDKGDKGDPGRSILTPLASGETVKGGIMLDIESSSVGDWRQYVPLNALAPVPLEDTDVFINGKGSEPCTGTADEPTAPAGKVCIYLVASSGMTVDANNPWAYADAGFGPEAQKRGFIFAFFGDGGGDSYAQGSWAYTAA
jgi:hypothetical protein